MSKIKKNEWIMLLGKQKSFVVRCKGKFHCEFGIINLDEVVGKKFGIKVKSHLGEEFVVVKPFLTDLMKKLKRAPQVILPKDASVILAKTGVGKNSIVIDAGSGSGFLAIFLSNYVKKVYTYEKNEKFHEIVKENIKTLKIKNIVAKLKDVSQGFDEKDVDLVVLDLENPEKIVKHAYEALRAGGWLVVFCPFAEEVGKVVKEMQKKGFVISEIIENLQRNWEISFDKKDISHLRAAPYVTFTGFLVFGRKR
jgi:tRNA (adenine57-N1/adenine58-N1)-methyltransferase